LSTNTTQKTKDLPTRTIKSFGRVSSSRCTICFIRITRAQIQ
jgi:hypothetical protein